MTDAISDMLNRIRNAGAVIHQTADVPFSNVKSRIAEILKAEGFIADFKKRGKKSQAVLRIDLKYDASNVPAISGFKRVSKPGQRIYKKAKEIKKIRNGYGVAIVSTNKGIITDKEVRKTKVGGEVMLEIW